MKVLAVLVAAAVLVSGSATPGRAEHASGGEVPAMAALLLVAGSAAYDIVSAPASARRYNQRSAAVGTRMETRSGAPGLAPTHAFGSPGMLSSQRPSLLFFYEAHLAQSPAADPPSQPAPDKSPGAAFALSLGGTLVPIALGLSSMSKNDDKAGAAMIAAGVIVGPSLGHLYAGEARRGAFTMGLRLGLGLAVVALYSCCT